MAKNGNVWTSAPVVGLAITAIIAVVVIVVVVARRPSSELGFAPNTSQAGLFNTYTSRGSFYGTGSGSSYGSTTQTVTSPTTTTTSADDLKSLAQINSWASIAGAPQTRFDLNNDGWTDYDDVRFIAQNAAQLRNDCDPVRCDINRQNGVTAYDASLLARWLERIYDINRDGVFNDQDARAVQSCAVFSTNDCIVEQVDLSGNGSISAYDASFFDKIYLTKQRGGYQP